MEECMASSGFIAWTPAACDREGHIWGRWFQREWEGTRQFLWSQPIQIGGVFQERRCDRCGLAERLGAPSFLGSE